MSRWTIIYCRSAFSPSTLKRAHNLLLTIKNTDRRLNKVTSQIHLPASQITYLEIFMRIVLIVLLKLSTLLIATSY
jgi:hypothetical protein